MRLSKHPRAFLKEFMEPARNSRGHTPMTLYKLEQWGLIEKVRVDEDNYPIYQTTEAGKKAYEEDSG